MSDDSHEVSVTTSTLVKEYCGVSVSPDEKNSAAPASLHLEGIYTYDIVSDSKGT
jgi:hypothetical protein